jgi:ABC-type bacteriocin/lantibiotic exporter with double-glycine peptidase domain
MLKILKTIDSSFKRKIINFYALLTLVTFFEFLAVFIILPISQIFFKQKIEISFFLTDYLNSMSLESLITISVMSLLTVHLIKNILAVYFAWWKLNFICKFEEKISSKLILKYLHEDYNFFQKCTIGKFSNYLTNEVSNFSLCLISILHLISEAVIFIALASMLIFYQTKITIFLVMLILVVAIISGILLKKYSSTNGEKWVKSSNKINDFVIQCYNGIIEIKVYSKFKFFSTIFARYKSDNVIFKRNASIIGELPRPIFEFILILSFSILVYYLLSSQNLKNLPEIMSLFIAGAYRLIPAVTRFSNLWQHLSKNKYLINSLVDQLKTSHKKENIININNNSFSAFNEKIELRNVGYAFEANEKKILNNFNLLIKKNQSTAIVGKSGCGKTTLLNIILGFLSPQEGSLIVDDNLELSKIKIDEWLSCVSYVPQNSVIINGSIMTNVTLDHNNINYERLKFSLTQAFLDEDVKKFSSGLDTIIGSGGVNLSGGQKQRISIARALYKNSQIIILDEPTSALDSTIEKVVLENLFSLKNKTIIMVTHKTNFLDKFDQVINL